MIVSRRFVYAVRHNVTKRIYIGSTTRVPHRIKEHINLLRSGKHKNERMQLDYNQHGEDYSFYELDVIPTAHYKDREYFWMLFFDTYDPEKGYNDKDWTAKNLNITDFPRVNLDEKPIMNRDMLTCFDKTAKYLGLSLDELMNYKRNESEDLVAKEGGKSSERNAETKNH